MLSRASLFVAVALVVLVNGQSRQREGFPVPDTVHAYEQPLPFYTICSNNEDCRAANAVCIRDTNVKPECPKGFCACSEGQILFPAYRSWNSACGGVTERNLGDRCTDLDQPSGRYFFHSGTECSNGVVACMSGMQRVGVSCAVPTPAIVVTTVSTLFTTGVTNATPRPKTYINHISDYEDICGAAAGRSNDTHEETYTCDTNKNLVCRDQYPGGLTRTVSRCGCKDATFIYKGVCRARMYGEVCEADSDCANLEGQYYCRYGRCRCQPGNFYMIQKFWNGEVFKETLSCSKHIAAGDRTLNETCTLDGAFIKKNASVSWTSYWAGSGADATNWWFTDRLGGNQEPVTGNGVPVGRCQDGLVCHICPFEDPWARTDRARCRLPGSATEDSLTVTPAYDQWPGVAKAVGQKISDSPLVEWMRKFLGELSTGSRDLNVIVGAKNPLEVGSVLGNFENVGGGEGRDNNGLYRCGDQRQSTPCNGASFVGSTVSSLLVPIIFAFFNRAN